jgi:UDP-N-acetylmuramate dehydrogenase
MLEIKEYVDIKNYSTLHIGGQFRYFSLISSALNLASICEIAKTDKKFKNIPIFVLGGGSNIVFSDGIINLFALKMEIKGFEIINETNKHADIKVGAGEIWDKLVEETVEMNLSGLEALSGIPGTVGATPVQNVGAYGAEVKDTIFEVEVFDIKDSKMKILSNKDCKFGYRDSIFKNEAKGRYIIISVTYRLKKIENIDPQDIAQVITYPGVKKYFEEKGIENPTLKQIREAIIEIRKEKLPNPKIVPNVGSFFKNPIVPKEMANEIQKEFPNVKFFPVDNNSTKVPAGWLIENAGLKGKSFGNVSVYDRNALVLINNGNATKKDLIKARNEIIKTVSKKFRITLEQEPEII